MLWLIIVLWISIMTAIYWFKPSCWYWILEECGVCGGSFWHKQTIHKCPLAHHIPHLDSPAQHPHNRGSVWAGCSAATYVWHRLLARTMNVLLTVRVSVANTGVWQQLLMAVHGRLALTTSWLFLIQWVLVSLSHSRSIPLPRARPHTPYSCCKCEKDMRQDISHVGEQGIVTTIGQTTAVKPLFCYILIMIAL